MINLTNTISYFRRNNILTLLAINLFLLTYHSPNNILMNSTLPSVPLPLSAPNKNTAADFWLAFFCNRILPSYSIFFFPSSLNV